VTPAPPPLTVPVDQLPLVREQVEAFLAGSAVPADAITREPPEAPRHYLVHHRSPKAGPVEQLRQRLRQLSPPLLLGTPEDGVLAITDAAGTVLLSIQFLPVPSAAPVKPAAPGKGGRVAIIMDDLGRGVNQARKLLALSQPVTLAVLPGEAHAAEVARQAHAAGREVMLHVPLEPQGYPVVDPGDDALLLSQSEGELQERLRALLARVPHAVGANNHMGSRFTEDERGMTTVMQVLKERDLFFVDSLTSSHSVGVDVARRAGVSVLRRDLFLDNVADVGAIAREIERLAEKARRNGSAVGICHPYPETFEALQRELPRLEREGIEFVRVGELMRQGLGTRD
jgi:hypothetical protein